MKRSQIPRTAFINPSGSNLDVIEQFIYKAADRILSTLASSESRVPLPSQIDLPSPGLPDKSIGDEKLIDHLESLLIRSMNPSHPGWIAHMDPLPTTASLIGDFAAAAVNNNMLSVEMSPAFSRLEKALTEEICRLFGLGKKASGMLCSGGSLANLQALAVARNVTFNTKERGLRELPHQPVLFASEVAHTSIQKAAMILGLGERAVWGVPVDADSKVDPVALKKAIQQAKDKGKAPFCVVATAGTTTTGNIDPLKEIGNICQKEDLWFHIDAAYGGALAFSDRHRHLLNGISEADSVTFNPQKWMYVAKTCAMILFRDKSLLNEHFRVGAPYMQNDEELSNIGEISVQGTRHADVLKLWASLQHLGKKGYEQLINESCRITTLLADKLSSIECIRFASQPQTNILCFRGEPGWISPSKWDSWNAGLQKYLLEEHQMFFSLPVYKKGKWLRTVILNPFVSDQTVQKITDGVSSYIRSTE